ncbi:MAG: 30S ribosome-binding factor RbfA, partial [Candidatus Dadabacteria bacterium]|nr:30S ribosome-binding factor RbfA [Candidatus Dadabacteria bacterium]
MGLVTLSNINVSPDLKNAKIYITCLGNTVNKNEIVNSLNEHTGHFRHELTRMVSLKFIPKLQFEFDTSLEKANRLT